MDQVGAWLSARPDIGYGPVLSALGRTLQPFVPVDVRGVEDFGRVPANYAVVYIESVQRAANPPLYAAIGETVPLHVIVIHGIEYARIHQLPRPFVTPLAARFGEGLRLRGDVWFAPMEEIAAHVQTVVKNGQWQPRIDRLPYYSEPVRVT